ESSRAKRSATARCSSERLSLSPPLSSPTEAWGGHAEPDTEGTMQTRRQFFTRTAAPGVAFCSCAWLEAVWAQPAGQRRPVSVGGKRVKTIDVHAHCLFHEAAQLMGEDNAAFTSPVKGASEAFITLEERLKAMDAMAVDLEVLSINPFWYRKERALAA